MSSSPINPNPNLTNDTPLSLPPSTTKPKPKAKEPTHHEPPSKPKASRLPRLTLIIPGLYLGNLPALHNPILLHERNITAIVSLTTSPWVRDPTLRLAIGISPSHHKCLPIVDSSIQDLLFYMSDICDFIDRMACPELHACTTITEATRLPTGTGTGTEITSTSLPTNTTVNQTNSTPAEWSVLVHCDLGRSRSPTIIIAYLMRKFKMKMEDAVEFVQAKQRIKPNKNFLRQLRVWEEVGYCVWEDEDKDKDGDGDGGSGKKRKRVPKEAYRNFLKQREDRLWEMGFG
ncbi:hypothetical protein ASPCADRAFT_506631 [Aspergillus carbonarius ITEM 5010]|uniref:protein-tyrosine-phosphatase n=1 Tax=Aspergillus carbonarius (strain ITEM 5010) TaxID=602072 RepID=A0A1R3RMV6_ASPC5|nr:hypothetical protein ASPCADRAFT_506631 [Aspergillus carbonarius ITEM 5010]